MILRTLKYRAIDPRISSRKVRVSQTKHTGWGLFAIRNFKKGDTIFVVRGKKVFWEVHDRKTSWYGPNWLGFSASIWIVPESQSPWIYINHSCRPTASIKGSVTVVALQSIKQGEEVTVDYATTEEDTLWRLQCKCHSKRCRHTVRSIQFLPAAIYKSYLPYISRYFQKVYTRQFAIGR